MSKVYGYDRLALANEEEKRQKLKVIYDYCTANNLKVDRYFFDNGVSGLTLNRKDLKELLNIAQKGDIIVVPGIAALSRSYTHCIELVTRMERTGVQLIIIDNETK